MIFFSRALILVSSELHSQFLGVLILLSLQIVCSSLQVWRDAVWQNVAKLHSYISKHESELIAQHVFLFFVTNSVSAFVPSLVEAIEVSELQVCIFLTINSLRAQYMFHAIFQAPTTSVTVFRLILSEQEKLVGQPHVAKANPCLSNAECSVSNSSIQFGVSPVITLSRLALFLSTDTHSCVYL